MYKPEIVWLFKILTNIKMHLESSFFCRYDAIYDLTLSPDFCGLVLFRFFMFILSNFLPSNCILITLIIAFSFIVKRQHVKVSTKYWSSTNRMSNTNKINFHSHNPFSDKIGYNQK